MISWLLVTGLISGAGQAAAPPSGHPGIEVSQQEAERVKPWWLKSKSEPKPKASKAEVRRVLVELAKEQIDAGIEAKSLRFAQARTALKQLGQGASGVNWPALYAQIYTQQLNEALRRELLIEIELQNRRNDEDALALLLLEAL